MIRWGILAAYITFIYATLGDAGRSLARLQASGWSAVVVVGTPAAIALALGAVAWGLIARWRERRPGVYAGLAGASAFYVLMLWRFRHHPSEQLHLIEYGLVGVLCVWAMGTRGGRARGVLYGLGLAAWIGLVDELIQGELPSRYYDFADVWLNALSAAAGVALWRLIAGARSAFRERAPAARR